MLCCVGTQLIPFRLCAPCNPVPLALWRYVFANGSVLLAYKGGRTLSFPGMYQGMAFAATVEGPFTRLDSPGKPLQLPGDCEDPGIYRDPVTNVFRMVSPWPLGVWLVPLNHSAALRPRCRQLLSFDARKQQPHTVVACARCCTAGAPAR